MLISNPLISEEWNYIIFGNSLKSYVIAIISFPLLWALFKVLQYFILHKFKKIASKTKTDLDDTFIEILQSLKPPFYFFLTFYFSLKFLVFHEAVEKLINAVLLIWIVYQLVIAVQILITYGVKKIIDKEDANASHALGALSKIAKYGLWILGGLLILSNLGINVTSLIAGLGIGGIAVALALQNILSDLFSSFAIYFDKPFQPGDFIVVGEHKGTVQRIGIKTTRLKSLQGEEIIISNKELTSARVQNYKRMQERRISFTFGVVYQTDPKTLRIIPKIVKKIITNIKDARFDRAHFNLFGPFSLDFEVVYFVQTSDYKKYMDIHEKILLKIAEGFAKERIVFAYPTQTLYIEKPPPL